MRKMILSILFLLPVSVFSQCDSVRLRIHVATITQDFGNRDHLHPDHLNGTAIYIFNELIQYADEVHFQEYEVEGESYRNVVASFGDTALPVIVIGAHYDVCGEQAGADDNASGVAGLIELGRMLDTVILKYRIELVAYSLEEPPFFRTQQMGSYVHAKALHDAGTDVVGMISLEMIGYFKDEKGTQDYPAGILKCVYGSRGNYITLVSGLFPGRFVKKMNRKYKHSHTIRTKKFRAPATLPGIDFSDHLNYWHFGYRAFMITDTAFFRNKNYHDAKDTIDLLDFDRMAKVVDGLYTALLAY